MPVISIIIPFYNTEPEYYEKSFGCLRGLSEEAAEVLVVDDGSSDAVYQAMKDHLDSELPTAKLFRRKNGGQNAARRYGIDQATGSYVLFLDSDDYVDAGLVLELCAFLETRNPDVVAFNYDIVSPEGETLDRCSIWDSGFSKADPRKLALASDSLCRQCYSLESLRALDYGLVQGINIGEDLSSALSINLALRDCWSFGGVLYHYVKRPTSIIHKTPNTSIYDIFSAFDEVIARCGPDYYGCRFEVEWMAIQHCLGWNSMRLLRAGVSPREAREFTFSWMRDRFPGWERNMYIRSSPMKKKPWFRLVLSGHWGMLGFALRLWDGFKIVIRGTQND